MEGGADYIVAETFSELGEALLALSVIKKYGKGELPVIFLLMFKVHGMKMMMIMW